MRNHDKRGRARMPIRKKIGIEEVLHLADESLSPKHVIGYAICHHDDRADRESKGVSAHVSMKFEPITPYDFEQIASEALRCADAFIALAMRADERYVQREMATRCKEFAEKLGQSIVGDPPTVH